MKKRKFKIASWFIREDLEHKVTISYDNETKRAYDLLEIMLNKYWKIDNRKSYNDGDGGSQRRRKILPNYKSNRKPGKRITRWDAFKDAKEEKESKRLLKAMKKFFGNPKYNDDDKVTKCCGQSKYQDGMKKGNKEDWKLIEDKIEQILHDYPNTISVTPIFCDECGRFKEYKSAIDLEKKW